MEEDDGLESRSERSARVRSLYIVHTSMLVVSLGTLHLYASRKDSNSTCNVTLLGSNRSTCFTLSLSIRSHRKACRIFLCVSSLSSYNLFIMGVDVLIFSGSSIIFTGVWPYLYNVSTHKTTYTGCSLNIVFFL